MKKLSDKSLTDRTKYWLMSGYTKPTARSMAILNDAIEYAEGNPSGTSFTPFTVKLKDSACQEMKLDNPFICRAKALHETAGKWIQLHGEIFASQKENKNENKA